MGWTDAPLLDEKPKWSAAPLLDAPADAVPNGVDAATGLPMAFAPPRIEVQEKTPSDAVSPVVSRERIASTYKPTGLGAFFDGVAQGMTLGFADEIGAALGGEQVGNIMKASTDASKRDRPKTQFAGEIAGAVAIPVPGAKAGATLKDAVKYGAKAGAALGAGYGAGTGEGGVVDRIAGAVEGAASGAIFGAAVPLAVNFGSKAFRRMFKASSERPTLESLKATKKAAYSAVDSAGEKFGPAEMSGLAKSARDAVEGMDNFLPEQDLATVGMLKKLDLMSPRELTLGQIDKFRQGVWDRYNSGKERALLEIIDAIDELVDTRTATSELMDAARLSNARFKKAEMLDMAFDKSARETAASGSGGNILNKMKQAVNGILSNPKKAKWFSPQEVDAMRKFVEGTATQNTMRLIGKLAPTGNGLMTALNLGAVATNPAMLAVSAGASGMKALADRGAEKGAQELIGMVGGGMKDVATKAITYPGRLNALGAPIAEFTQR